MDPFIDSECAHTDRLAAAVGIGTSLFMSIALWLAMVDAWLMLR